MDEHSSSRELKHDLQLWVGIMENNILTVDNLNSGYGNSQVIFDATLKVRRGSICAILGPNGSGKSTAMKSIFGLTKIYSGSIKIDGQEIAQMKPDRIARCGVAYLPQVENIYLQLMVRENFLMAGYTLQRHEIDARMEEALEFFPALKSYINMKALILSGGQRQMLGMAMALINKPRLMMLDEPATNLSPKLAESVFEKVVLLNSLGISILLIEQDVRRALKISEHVYLLVSGRIHHHDTAKNLAADANLGRLFLGVESRK